jgi:hypothetical protein
MGSGSFIVVNINLSPFLEKCVDARLDPSGRPVAEVEVPIIGHARHSPAEEVLAKEKRPREKESRVDFSG